jgi:hypothetical protein
VIVFVLVAIAHLLRVVSGAEVVIGGVNIPHCARIFHRLLRPGKITAYNLARVAGFSLHAASVCEAHQRSRLERLCRYFTRPPIATKRLSVDDRGPYYRSGSLRG